MLLMLLISCRVHNTQKKNELEKLEKQLKIADQKLSSEGRQLDTLEHKVERLDNMREVCSCSPALLSQHIRCWVFFENAIPHSLRVGICL